MVLELIAKPMYWKSNGAKKWQAIFRETVVSHPVQFTGYFKQNCYLTISSREKKTSHKAEGNSAYLTWAVQVGGRVAAPHYSSGRNIELTNSRCLH